MEAATPPPPFDERSGRIFVLGAIATLALVGAYFALGMPGMAHSGDDMADMDHPAGLQELSPEQFEARIAEGDAYVVNVHVPAGDSIKGTDETIAFDEIVEPGRLPADKAAPILLYCESGRMSETAGRRLLRAGYMDVSHLAGGLEAWRRAGLQLAPASPQAMVP